MWLCSCRRAAYVLLTVTISTTSCGAFGSAGPGHSSRQLGEPHQSAHAGRSGRGEAEGAKDGERGRRPGPPRRLGVIEMPDIVEITDERAGDDDAGDDRRNGPRVGKVIG